MLQFSQTWCSSSVSVRQNALKIFFSEYKILLIEIIKEKYDLDVQKTRNNSLDLLRIISMMMVVSLHFFSHGGLVCGALVEGTANWYLGESVHAFSIVAVNCFALSSGYILINIKYKFSRIITMWLQVFLYSAVITSIFFIFNSFIFSFWNRI